MRKMMMVCMAVLLAGQPGESFEGKELWRKELGRERCLLLYVEEDGARRMVFTDGPWVYLTEELTERVKMAGMEFWEKGNGMSK